MKTLASRTYRLPTLILHLLQKAVRISVKRLALQIGELIRVPIKESSFARSADHRVSEFSSQARVLNVVEVGPALFGSGLLLSLAFFPLFPILLVKIEELSPRDQIKIEGATGSCDWANLEPSSNPIEWTLSVLNLVPALRKLVTWDQKLSGNLIAKSLDL